MNNPYAALGVNSDVSEEELAKTYRELAKKYHPDLHPGDKTAAEQMSRINKAYDDIKTMRQSGNRQNGETQRPQYEAYTPGYGAQAGDGGYDPGYDPFVYSNYRRYRSRRNPAGVIFGVFIAIMLFRLLLGLLMGGYTYYNTGSNAESYMQIPGGYGYYQTNP